MPALNFKVQMVANETVQLIAADVMGRSELT